MINFKVVGEQADIEFYLAHQYQHLAINKDTGVLTIDGIGVRNAWLDANFPLRLAKKKLTRSELEDSLRHAKKIVQDRQGHAKFIGVPVPEGVSPCAI